MRTFDEQRKYENSNKLIKLIDERGHQLAPIISIGEEKFQSFSEGFAYNGTESIRTGWVPTSTWIRDDDTKDKTEEIIYNLTGVIEHLENFEKENIVSWPNLMLVNAGVTQDEHVAIANPYAKIMQQLFIYEGLKEKIKEKYGELTKDNIRNYLAGSMAIEQNLNTIAKSRAEMMTRDALLAFSTHMDAALRDNAEVVEIFNRGRRGEYDEGRNNFIGSFYSRWETHEIKKLIVEALCDIVSNIAYSSTDKETDSIMSIRNIMKINEIVMAMYDIVDQRIVDMVSSIAERSVEYINPNELHALFLQEAYNPLEGFRDSLMQMFLTMRYEAFSFYHQAPIFNTKELCEKREELLDASYSDDINKITSAASNLEEGQSIDVEMSNGGKVKVGKF